MKNRQKFKELKEEAEQKNHIRTTKEINKVVFG